MEHRQEKPPPGSPEAPGVSEHGLAVLASMTNDAVIFIDEAGRISLFNPGAERIFGYARSEALGAPLDLLLPEADRAAHREHVHRFREGPACARSMDERRPIRGLRRNGEQFPAEASIAALEVGGKRVLGVVLRDRTDRLRIAEEERYRAETAIRAREDLLAAVSHDLKNPLGVILMNTALLQQGGPGDLPGWRTQIDRIQRSARRMARLVGDLLDLSSIVSGHLSIEPRPLPVSPLVCEIVDSMQPLADTKALDLRAELPPELPPISADRSRLEQVFMNLLGNAIKFTPPCGAITVRAEVAGGSVLFSVSDTGPGIGERDLHHLFERYWQAPQTARQGTGLGLFIARGVVEAHGGRIWAESQLSRGTTFFFTLPTAAGVSPDDPSPARGPEAVDPAARH